MASLNHTHTYKRYTKNRYMCAHPHCMHYTDKKMLVGKASCCNICGKEFFLTIDDLKRSKPRCLNCSDTSRSRRHRMIRTLVADVIKAELPEEAQSNDAIS